MQVRKRGIVIGLGETGAPLLKILEKAYPGQVVGYDAKAGRFPYSKNGYEVLNICFPYGEKFTAAVQDYKKRISPNAVVIHSTVPVGTTKQIGGAVHSPILGKHGKMERDLLAYTKWFGGKGAREAAEFFKGAGFKTRIVGTAEETELLKIMCLAKYGVSIAFAIYQKEVCEKMKVPFGHVVEWDMNYNTHVSPHLRRPFIDPPINGKIRGHCVVPGARILNGQFPDDLLRGVLKYG